MLSYGIYHFQTGQWPILSRQVTLNSSYIFPHDMLWKCKYNIYGEYCIAFCRTSSICTQFTLLYNIQVSNKNYWQHFVDGQPSAKYLDPVPATSYDTVTPSRKPSTLRHYPSSKSSLKAAKQRILEASNSFLSGNKFLYF